MPQPTRRGEPARAVVFARSHQRAAREATPTSVDDYRDSSGRCKSKQTMSPHQDDEPALTERPGVAHDADALSERGDSYADVTRVTT